MSLVELRQTGETKPNSGDGMDRVVASRRIDKRLLIGGGAAAVLLLVLLFWLFAPRADSQSVERDRLAIATVQSGVFEDFMPLRARVTPLLTVYLDAVEGGRVDKMLVEDGATVAQGPAARRTVQCRTCSFRRSRARPRSSSRSTICAARNWRWRRPGSRTIARLLEAETRLAKARRQYEP